LGKWNAGHSWTMHKISNKYKAFFLRLDASDLCFYELLQT
jgi:hypothetical protein